MLLSILNILILVASIQGIIFSLVAFLSKKHKSRSTYFLVLLILGFSLNNLQYYLLETNVVTPTAFFGYVYFPFASLNMVFYYFYVKYFLFPSKPFNRKNYLFFLPFLVFLLATIYYKIGYLSGNLTENTKLFFTRLIYIHELFSVSFSMLLLGMSYFQILKFEKIQKTGRSNLPRIQLDWLKILSLISLVLCIIWFYSIVNEIVTILKKETIQGANYYILWIGMSMTIYILGHIGIYRFGVLTEQKNIQKKLRPLQNGSKNNVQFTQNNHFTSFEKYVKTDKNYLNSSLSLVDVATYLDLNTSYLSRIINAELESGFTDYVNQLRVEEAKQYLKNKEFSNYTLLAIGLEAGFNSKSAFNSAFKKYTGKTPSAFRKSLPANPSS